MSILVAGTIFMGSAGALTGDGQVPEIVNCLCPPMLPEQLVMGLLENAIEPKEKAKNAAERLVYGLAEDAGNEADAFTQYLVEDYPNQWTRWVEAALDSVRRA